MPSGIKTDVRNYQLYINGEWTDSSSKKTFPVYDPSTEEVIAQAPDAGPEDEEHRGEARSHDQEDEDRQVIRQHGLLRP